MLLVVVTYSFAKCSANEKTGTINDEIVWHDGKC